jgi:hypothetical protein
MLLLLIFLCICFPRQGSNFPDKVLVACVVRRCERRCVSRVVRTRREEKINRKNELFFFSRHLLTHLLTAPPHAPSHILLPKVSRIVHTYNEEGKKEGQFGPKNLTDPLCDSFKNGKARLPESLGDLLPTPRALPFLKIQGSQGGA